MKKTEWKLISELMKDSRRSDRSLARAVGVSQPTVARMIKKLEKEGYIKEYTMIPDFLKLGYHLLALVFVKLKSGLSSEWIERARRLAKEALKADPFEVLMVERGMGMGYDGVFLSLHEDYASYLKFKDWLKQFAFLEWSKIDSFIIGLDDEVNYRPFTLAALAKHLQTLKGEECPPWRLNVS